MYLKALEMVGFKSFAEKTKLMFEPGMTAIVGPNGCGKSNVSDAIRWVLGEQSAKALRGAKMEDCIFNGTQNRKPLGMAEVSITFTDCEEVLKTEYHEVTITRRVFRSGEGQYFINKTPCRLRDVQRLFMDTGVGTSSYSFMAQGRIDQILSARPEDRRSIFEEASGITKFKNDKREAIRKLEHTEANLLRLADVIREVKRQIGSLQRQAGKARRYRSLTDELRGLDLFAARIRLTDLDKQIRQVEGKIKTLTEQISAAHHDVESKEERNAALREEILSTERQIATFMEAELHAQNRLDRSQDLIRTNTQRIDEYRSLSERDTREMSELQRQLDDNKRVHADIKEKLETARANRDQAKTELDAATTRFDEHRQLIDTARQRIQQLRDESVKLEDKASQLHNQILQIDAQERSTLIQRERLAAEKQQLSEISKTYAERLTKTGETLKGHEQEVTAAEAQCSNIEELLRDNASATREIQQKRSDHLSARAARQATIDLLTDAEEMEGDFPGGAKLLLDQGNPLGVDSSRILGALAEHLTVQPEYTRALEASLRSMLDAIVVADGETARSVLHKLADAAKGAARLVIQQGELCERPQIPNGLTPLADVVKTASDSDRSLVERLLKGFALAETINDLPDSIPEGITVVTRDGIVWHSNGACEFWMGDPGAANPLSRRNAIMASREAIASIENEIGKCESEYAKRQQEADSLSEQAAQARRQLDEARRKLAQKEGESQLVANEAKTAEQRLETVTWELDELTGKGSSWDTEKQTLSVQQSETRETRERISHDISEQSKELRDLETRQGDIQTELTERRVAYGSNDHRVEHLSDQLSSVASRVTEIDATLRGRSQGVESYEATIAQLLKSTEEAENQLEGLEAAVSENSAKAKELRDARSSKAEKLAVQEHELTREREKLEAEMQNKSELDLQLMQTRMRSQNLTERVTGDYGLTLTQVMNEPEPEWEGEPLPLEEAETRVAELRTKLEAMGPVNLVAIEEYKEHEERYTFLTQQEDDLVNAKEQLMDMIKTINKTTSEMFRSTFEEANANFQSMFTQLFNGGTAKLVLVNEEDVLDCGIEIIARPPGKRLQNISLLSGGERTLTAVALLFAIYQIKPSPFCMLDELDAPLDDSNIGRFIDILKEFLQQSQFVVITHSRQTISASDILYGVTMPERGVSRIMSMKFRDTNGGVLTNEEIGISDSSDSPVEPDSN